MLRRRTAQRGDTLIEVLFAVTVFSLIVVGALSVMNQGTSASRRALESTLTRQAIDGQAETLRFLHESYVANYKKNITYDLGDTLSSPAERYFQIIKNAKEHVKAQASPLTTEGTTCPAAPANSFILDPKSSRVSFAPTVLTRAQIYPELIYNGANVLLESRGMWIEAVRPADVAGVTDATVIDFHIRACWLALGSTVPVTLGTIVRLYEPRG